MANICQVSNSWIYQFQMLLGLSLNDVFLIIFFKLNLGSKIIFKIQDDVEGPVYLI